MKKLCIILVFSTFTLFSCSNSDDNKTESVTTYTANTQTTCPNGTIVEHIITQTTYNNINQQMTVGSTCQWISFKDIKGLSIKGYLRGISYTKS